MQFVQSDRYNYGAVILVFVQTVIISNNYNTMYVGLLVCCLLLTSLPFILSHSEKETVFKSCYFISKGCL